MWNNISLKKIMPKTYGRWCKIYDPIKDHKVLSIDPLLDKIQDKIIQDKNAAMAYFCAPYFPNIKHI